MFRKILLLQLLVVVLNLNETHGIKVSIYYDASQVDSKRMFIESVVPGFKRFSNQVDFQVELFPFTKTVDTLQCSSECTANKIQACSVNQNKSNLDKLEFVKCASKQGNPADIFYIKVCINYWGFDYDRITTCTNGEEGNNLIAENAKKASQYSPGLALDTPFIVFDDEFIADNSAAAVMNFFYGACKAMEYQPKICSES